MTLLLQLWTTSLEILIQRMGVVSQRVSCASATGGAWFTRNWCHQHTVLPPAALLQLGRRRSTDEGELEQLLPGALPSLSSDCPTEQPLELCEEIKGTKETSGRLSK